MKDFLTWEKGNQSIHLAAVSEILFISHNHTSQVCLVAVNMQRFEFIYVFVTLEKFFFHPISGRKSSSPLRCLPLKTCEIFKGNNLNMLVFLCTRVSIYIQYTPLLWLYYYHKTTPFKSPNITVFAYDYFHYLTTAQSHGNRNRQGKVQ